MGYNVGSLSRLPLAIHDYYIFVVGDPEISSHARWVARNFTSVASTLPPRTAIVTGTDQRLSQDIGKLISDWTERDHSEDTQLGWSLFSLLADGTTLIISKGDIRKTNEPLLLIPLSAGGILEGAGVGDAELEEFMAQVFQAVCGAIRDGNLDELVARLGASRVPLKAVKGGLVITTLRRVNEVLELKPNLGGLGVNLNAIIEGWLSANPTTR